LEILTDPSIRLGVGIRSSGATMDSKTRTTLEPITTMDRQHRLQLAHRIHLGLVRELGQGIDIGQMLGSALYARDVLLVCQAYPAGELPWLGEQFRKASAEHSEPRAARPADWALDSSGFGASRPSTGLGDFVDTPPAARPTARRWLTPSSWFAR
jgi:hypothetical protein